MNTENLELAYHRYIAFNSSLSYKVLEFKEKKKDSLGKEYEEVRYEIRANSRIIYSNIKDKDEAYSLVNSLNKSMEEFLTEEKNTFKKVVAEH